MVFRSSAQQKIYLVGALVLGVLVACIYILYSLFVDYQKNDVTEVTADRSGEIVLTLTPLLPGGASFLSTPAVFRPNDRVFGLLPAEGYFGTSSAPAIVYHNTLSRDGRYEAFVGAQNVDQYGLSIDTVPLTVYVVDRAEDTPLPQAVYTSEPGTILHHPSVSNNGDVLFSWREEDVNDSERFTYDAEKWTIGLWQGGEYTAITGGVSPKWVGTDRFLSLGDDGIYLYDLSTDELTLLFESPLLVNGPSALAVSLDGTKVAFVHMVANVVRIFNYDAITRTLTPSSELVMNAQDAVFAPDGKTLAVLRSLPSTEVNMGEDLSQEFVSVIDFIDVATNDLLEEARYIIEGTAPQLTYITEWR